MKYTVEGFSQPRLVELGLDAVDAVLLRWFVDFYPMMRKVVVEEQEHGWVAFSHAIEDLPVLGITNTEVIGRRFQKLCKASVLHGWIDRKDGSKTYFVFGSAYPPLVAYDPATLKSSAGDSKVSGPATQTSDNPSSNDPSTRSKKESAAPMPSVGVTVPTKPVTDLFSALFSEKRGGAKFSFKAYYVFPTQELIRRNGLPAVLAKVRAYFGGEWWFTRVKDSGGRHTWSYSGFLAHYDEIDPGAPARENPNAEAASRLVRRTV